MPNLETQIQAPRKTLPIPRTKAVPAAGNPRVFDFLDYRAFLKAFYEQTKRATKGRFSYRVFSQKTGVNSPNYLKLIVDGQRNLTHLHAKRVAKYCGMSEAETHFFTTLVKWNQGKNLDEQSRYWNELLVLRTKSGFRLLSTSQLAVITDLRLVALFELLQVSPNASTETLAARLRLPMSADEITRGLDTLESAKLIRRDGKKISILATTLKSEDDVPSKSIRQYHHQAMTAAEKALHDVPLDQREFISSTIALPANATPEVKAILRETRDRLLALGTHTAGADSVFQINIQFFPLTNSKPEPV